jgi:hypothetical protein
VSPGADEAAVGEVVLPVPEAVELGREGSRLAVLVAHRPVATWPADRVEERRQDDVCLPEHERDPNAVDERRRLLERAHPRHVGIVIDAGA